MEAQSAEEGAFERRRRRCWHPLVHRALALSLADMCVCECVSEAGIDLLVGFPRSFVAAARAAAVSLALFF